MTYKQIKRVSIVDQGIRDQEVTISGTQQILMRTKVGKPYQIFISKPIEDPPPSGYPIIYVLDANSIFGTIVEAVRLQSRRPEKTGVVPAVIVGIGYPTDEAFSPSRYYDFTMSVSVSELPQRPDGKPWPQHGGAKHFLEFIEEELKPRIQSYFNIDSKRETLFGHSLGGLFVLQTLYTKPSLFQTYIAGSPSIHWDEKFFFEKEKEFQSKLRQKDIIVDVFVGVGELEKKHKCHMNDNAREFSRRLSSLEKYGIRVVEFKEFEGEGHLSILLPLINRTLQFALSPNHIK